MDDNNMSHLPKYDEVQECAEGLDQYADVSVDIPAELGSEGIVLQVAQPIRKGRGLPRQARLDGAFDALRQVISHCEQKHEGSQEAESLVTELQEIVDNLDGAVSFPGMY